jgi:asparagine synthase (glutamine-hydrolysing)
MPDPGEPLLAKISRMELRGYAGFVLLRDIDAMSMNHSLEVRVPFLDKRFMEFAFSIPLQYRLRGTERKYLLKRAMEGVLPNDIIYRSKMGFGIPLVLWMQQRLRPLIDRTLSTENVTNRGIFDPVEINRLKNAFFAGQTAYERRLWTLFVLEQWLQRFVDRPYAADSQAQEEAICAGAGF